MSRRVEGHRTTTPSERARGKIANLVFFPGEVADLLGLANVEYDQLRRLFVLARILRGEPHPGRKWSRFTLADLAATEVLVALGGGRSQLNAGKRLVLGELEAACLALRAAGIENPLLQVPMVRVGRRVFAQVDDYVVEPITGQLALDHVGDRLSEFLQEELISDRAVRAAINQQSRSLKLRRQLSVDVATDDGARIRIVAS